MGQNVFWTAKAVTVSGPSTNINGFYSRSWEHFPCPTYFEFIEGQSWLKREQFIQQMFPGRLLPRAWFTQPPDWHCSGLVGRPAKILPGDQRPPQSCTFQHLFSHVPSFPQGFDQ